jgi:hypothetical protein
VKAALLEPKCPTSKGERHGYNGFTSVGFLEKRLVNVAVERVEVVIIDLKHAPGSTGRR